MAHLHDTHGTAGNTPPAGDGRSGFRHLVTLIAVLVTTLVIASAWLVVPYFHEGQKALEDVSNQVLQDQNAESRTLAQVLTRIAEGPGDFDVDALYATETYFDRVSTPRAAAPYEADEYHVFIVNETTHIFELPQSLPEARLIIGDRVIEPYDIEGPVATDHHRTTEIRFPKVGPDGQPYLDGSDQTLTLEIANRWDGEANTPRQVSWEMPIDYPDAASTLTSPMIIMSVAAGLLSVTLTPCLIQLIVVYMATITGIGAEQAGRAGVIPAAARRQMLINAAGFVVGFMLFYTAAGALIGYAGKQAQMMFDAYSREMAFATGVLVIAMGIWMGIKSRAPLVCRMPVPAGVRTSDKSGFLRSALLSAGFSLGCMVCFSGAIMATLFVYVGALGSATTGAMILFLFSVGVAVPFLAAAFFLSRTMSVMNWISKYSPTIGFISMLIIVGFGIILITDNFHTVSDIIYPWLGLD